MLAFLDREFGIEHCMDGYLQFSYLGHVVSGGEKQHSHDSTLKYLCLKGAKTNRKLLHSSDIKKSNNFLINAWYDHHDFFMVLPTGLFEEQMKN